MVSTVAPVANLLAAPLVSVIILTGLLALVALPAFEPAGTVLVRLGALGCDLLRRFALGCSSLPLASFATPRPGPILAAALTATVLVRLLPRSRTRRWALASLAALAAGLIVAGAHDRWRSDRLDAWFASVGQGDAAVVRLPGGRVFVVDEGSPGRGRMVVAPLLRSRWIGRVDVLVASHVQSDHAGALTEILDDFDVGEVWLPDGPCTTAAALSIRQDAYARGVPVRFVSRDAVLPHDCSVEVLGPPHSGRACNDNDQCQVLAFAFGGRRVLFTGDIEATAEYALVSGGKVRADVLKVPHHGSRTSSTAAFVGAVDPAIAVMSLGLDNQFHFPAPEVERRYLDRGVRVLRTDRDGAVHVAIDAGGDISVETARSAPATQPDRH